MHNFGSRKCVEALFLRSTTFSRKQCLGSYYGGAARYASAGAGVVQRPTAKKGGLSTSQSPRPSRNLTPPSAPLKDAVSTPFKVSFPVQPTAPRKVVAARANAPPLPRKAPSSRPLLTKKIGLSNKDDEELNALSPAKRLEKMQEQLQDLAAATRMNPGVDPWAGPAALLDVHIPSWRSVKVNATWRDHVREWRLTTRNYILNVSSIWRMAKENSFPDMEVKSSWSPQVLLATNTKWLEPFRTVAQRTFLQVTEAINKMDDKGLKRLTSGDYYQMWMQKLKPLRTRKDGLTLRLDITKMYPPQVLSIRAVETYMGAEPPRFGNRLMVQALVVFRREQAVALYDKEGRKLTKDGVVAPNQEPEPKMMVDYLVLEKKMWYADAPWYIRDQLYPGVDVKLKEA